MARIDWSARCATADDLVLADEQGEQWPHTVDAQVKVQADVASIHFALLQRDDDPVVQLFVEQGRERWCLPGTGQVPRHIAGAVVGTRVAQLAAHFLAVM